MSEPHRIEALVAHRNGRLIFSRTKGMAPCEIWAEITVYGRSGNWLFERVYWGSAFTEVGEELTDDARSQAAAMLLADEGWQDWRADEVERRSGFREAPYEPITQSMVL